MLLRWSLEILLSLEFPWFLGGVNLLDPCLKMQDRGKRDENQAAKNIGNPIGRDIHSSLQFGIILSPALLNPREDGRFGC
jgi:hypothetical protein